MTPTLTVSLARMAVPGAAEWEALPADQKQQAAREAAATYDTIAATARALGRQYFAVSEAIAEQDVTGETSPKAAEALASWPHPVSQAEAERLRVMRLLADMAEGMREQAAAADKTADMWRSRAGDLFYGEAGAL